MIEHDLLEILSLPIPEPHKREPTFLYITGQTFKENTISKVYSYFLNSGNNKEIANLFLNALTEIIFDKTQKEIQFEEFVCRTEQSTKNGNRIDLIINSDVEKKCVIIENKIFHWLNNDLLDYWNINSYKDCDKVGIVLTLKTQKLATEVDTKFINITHKEWISKIKSKGFPVGISAKEFIYLNDFITHIENITENMEMNEQAKFFFNYPDKVLKAMNTYEEAYNYIIAQLKLVAEKMDWELYGSSRDWRHIWDSKNESHIYYAIEIHELLENQPRVNIIIELYKTAIDKKEEFKQKLVTNPHFISLSNENRSGPGWLHFVNKWYKLSGSDISNLSEFILDKIKEDFKPVMDVLLEEQASSRQLKA